MRNMSDRSFMTLCLSILLIGGAMIFIPICNLASIEVLTKEKTKRYELYLKHQSENKSPILPPVEDIEDIMEKE